MGEAGTAKDGLVCCAAFSSGWCWSGGVSDAVVPVLIDFLEKQGKETALSNLTSECWRSKVMLRVPRLS